MTFPALMIGGPADGEVYTLAQPEPYIAISERPEPVYFSPTEAPLFPEIRKVFYARTRLVLFGLDLAVYVYEGTDDRERDRLAAKYLLNPLALQLIP